MSYGLVYVFEGVTEADYWSVNDKLGIEREGDAGWPAGMISHVGGPTENGWVVIELWDSKEIQQAFLAERLGAALAATHVPEPVQMIETDPVSVRLRS